MTCPQNFLFYYEKPFFARPDPSRYRRSNIPENSHRFQQTRFQMKAYCYSFLVSKKSFFFSKIFKFHIFFYFFWTSNRTQNGTEGPIFKKILNLIQQTRSKIKAYYYSFVFWEKKVLAFFSNILKVSQFFTWYFFKFSFLPTYMFDFNKWGLKWKDVIFSFYASQKVQNFFFISTMNKRKNLKSLGSEEPMPNFLWTLGFNISVWIQNSKRPSFGGEPMPKSYKL